MKRSELAATRSSMPIWDVQVSARCALPVGRQVVADLDRLGCALGHCDPTLTTRKNACPASRATAARRGMSDALERVPVRAAARCTTSVPEDREQSTGRAASTRAAPTTTRWVSRLLLSSKSPCDNAAGRIRARRRRRGARERALSIRALIEGVASDPSYP